MQNSTATSAAMRVIPVMDVRGGVVVRGVGGRRDQYRPLVSQLTRSSKPREVARVLRTCAGTNELYVADLDAIAGGPPAIELFEQLAHDGAVLWVDAGLRHDVDARPLLNSEVAVAIAGLETLESPTDLAAMIWEYGEDRVAFSLDLFEGRPMNRSVNWPSSLPEILDETCFRVKRVILLDTSRVGRSEGVGSEDLCLAIRSRYSAELDLIVGGGVSGPEDLPRLQACGASGVLVASAFHDGRLRGAPGDPL